MDPGELYKESIEKCKLPVETKPTVKLIMEKVTMGCKMIEMYGKDAFLDFKGKDSEFLFAGTYIWIHSPKDTEMMMHPIEYKMEG